MMIIDDKISDEKLQYCINREAAKISALSPDEIHKYENLKVKKLPSVQSRMIKPAKFTYSLLGEALEKQRTKKIEEQVKGTS